MASVQVCALLLLVVAAVCSAEIPETIKPFMEECSKEHSIDDAEASFLSLDPKYSCFYACVMKKTAETLKDFESPKAKAFLSCGQSITKSGDECADAHEIKKCMLAKFHPEVKQS